MYKRVSIAKTQLRLGPIRPVHITRNC